MGGQHGPLWRARQSRVTDRADILARIDATLERMRAQEVNVRSIYLSTVSVREFDRATGAKGPRLHRGHAGHPLRHGSKDVIYSQHGVAFAVHKQLSHRVAAA